MKNANISIVIPAYNQAVYLPESVQSVLNQTVADFEVIIVDDGSTDNTREVALSFNDQRIYYIFQENAGLSAARNTGIRNASGDYLLFLDSDDLLMPNALELHLAAKARHPQAGLFVGGWVKINSSGSPLSEEQAPPQYIDFASLLTGNPFPVHGAMIARNWLDRIGLFDESLRSVEDWDLWLRFCIKGGVISTFSHTVCMYRMHPAQMTRNPDRMHTATLAVLDKLSQQQALENDSLTLLNEAYGAAYIKAACRFYSVKAVERAKRDLSQAIDYTPHLLKDDGLKLRQHFCGWAFAPSMNEPFEYLSTIYDNLPEPVRFLRRFKRTELALALLHQAETLKQQGRITEAGNAVCRAVFLRPQLLRNRNNMAAVGAHLYRRALGVS